MFGGHAVDEGVGMCGGDRDERDLAGAAPTAAGVVVRVAGIWMPALVSSGAFRGLPSKVGRARWQKYGREQYCVEGYMGY